MNHSAFTPWRKGNFKYTQWNSWRWGHYASKQRLLEAHISCLVLCLRFPNERQTRTNCYCYISAAAYRFIARRRNKLIKVQSKRPTLCCTVSFYSNVSLTGSFDFLALTVKIPHRNLQNRFESILAILKWNKVKINDLAPVFSWWTCDLHRSQIHDLACHLSYHFWATRCSAQKVT